MSEAEIVRSATTRDLETLRRIQHDVPSRELIGLAGSRRFARRLGRAVMTAAALSDSRTPTVVLERAGRVVGFLTYSVGAVAQPQDLRTVAAVVRALGPRAVTLPVRLRARAAVEHQIPPRSMYIAEVHAAPDLRGGGIGSALLAWTATRVQELGLPSRSLVTGTANPARRLYERHGFRVVAEAESDRYERYFGQRGRVLMVAPAISD